ncbi:acyl-CoA dehydrogenase [Novosphingobium album (ex Hu et al. 2023)]|uniref:Acyl-CoA dehydrogenase n=1 Tax=Novosphingobium album (ex Hu et al. 2023) TaxID=2930093 RepID=A0ABT0B7B9_9SPHN|nr:acyl-CoA dehydrogenase [Novosphingobium album (ex Hu et al. 2023)]MCJ2180753.1 acyl-CoA dehydrogenase [Novosphingobium album (ex Hu et al. 2023)]
MSDLLVSPACLEFLLFDWLRIDGKSGFDRETAGAILDMSSRLASGSFLSCYKRADVQEPYLDDSGTHILPEIAEALSQFRELGLFGASFPEELGGMGLPQSLSLAIYGLFASANISAAAYAMLTAGNARLISAFGTPAQIDMFARPEIEGRWFGTMCLSEAQAGSSLGDLRTRAVREGKDDLGERYRLTGNKMWISGADHDASENIIHLVLAKVANGDGSLPEGTQGISLFIVPKKLPDGTDNDVRVAGLNHKMGNRGTTNCLFNLGEEDGAIGWLVGAPGQGLPQMFQMMNEARISVGMGGAALACRGYRHAVRYARERTQGRPAGQRGGEPVPIIAHPDVRRMLLQQKAYAEAALALCLYCADLVDDGSEEAEELLALLTPVAKSWPSEFGLVANDLAIQVHGGYGYTRDFDVEQIWRDNRLNPIHEGTAGIQAIDLLGRKILRSDGQAMALLRRRIAATAEAARASAHWPVQAGVLDAYWDRVEAVVAGLRTCDSAEALDDATMFLRAFGHGIAAWLWLDMALTADAGGTGFAVGFASACRYFFEAELPQAHAWLAVVDGHGRSVRTCPDEAFI